MMSSVKGRWALVLGASSGFGEAISLKLAGAGLNIVGVHLDRKGTLPHVDEIVQKIEKTGSKALFFNVNAADAAKRTEVLAEVAAKTDGIHCLVHSLAFGSLKPFVTPDSKDRISQDQMNMTLDVMAHSLVYWTQDLFEKKLLREGAHIFAMTSSGGTRVWPTYGAVSAAKAALESHCRQLALELAPMNIAVNAIRAGVTDTPALRKIPGNEKMIVIATERNPARRLTTPEDVGAMIQLLVHDEARWMTGNVLGVDGGEDIVG
ncbi:MAG: SDR family oxidoreductase [Deltaproteobacteria bacterium]|nr:SDR family oxidoreductase [Deltaproteobacteria bacterium]MBI3296111.1 SDR family oxidoreductase [Deltaproteobacteria bacterium]